MTETSVAGRNIANKSVRIYLIRQSGNGGLKTTVTDVSKFDVSEVPIIITLSVFKTGP
jgi:hypothetical protein